MSAKSEEDAIAAQGPANFKLPPLEVEHAKLTPRGDSPYRSVCPHCKFGTLMVSRDENGKLRKDDLCILCARRFVYLDFNEMLEGRALHATHSSR